MSKSYGQIAYERYQYWKTGRVNPEWHMLSLGAKDDWEEAASAAINAWRREMGDPILPL